MLYDQPHQPPLPDGWPFRILLAVAALMRSFGALLAMGTSSILLTFAFEPLLRFLPLPRRLGENLLQGIPALIMCLIVTWVLLRFVHRSGLSDLGLRIDFCTVRELALAVLWGVAGLGLTVVPLLLFGLGEVAPATAKIHSPLAVFVLTILLFIAAVSEELFMRGYGFQTLIQPLHLLGALLFTSGIFAALHWSNPGANEFTIANTFLAGCALGLLFVVRRSLWAPIGAHFGWNLATILFGLNVSGLAMPIVPFTIQWHVDPLWTGGSYGPEGGLACTIVLSLLVLLETFLYYRQHRNLPILIAVPPADAE